MINAKILADGTELLNTVERLRAKPLITKQEYNDVKSALNEYLSDLNRSNHSIVRVTCAGNYNSGKSSVLNALTGGDNFKVGDVPTTSSIDEVEYEGFIYVDTPGLNANHFDNKTAQKAFKDADIILFISNILGGGLYSSEAEYLKKISNILGGSDNMKAQTIFALSNLHQVEDELVQKIVDEYARNIESTLGFKPDKIITYDAVTYETGIKEGKDLLVKTSGINELKNEIALAAKRFSNMSGSIGEQRISAKGIALENALNKVVQSFEVRISKLVKQSEARTVDKEAVDLAIKKCEETITSCKEAINSLYHGVSGYVDLGMSWGYIDGEKSERAALNRAKEKVQKAYDRRESKVRSKAVEIADYIWKIASSESSDYFPKKAKETADAAIITCGEILKNAGIIVPTQLIKNLDITIPQKTIDERSIRSKLEEDVVEYGGYYSVDEYVSMYCDTHELYDHAGRFGKTVYKYDCYYSDAISEMEKDLSKNFNSNLGSVWSNATSGFPDFQNTVFSQLEARLRSLIQEARSIAGSSGSDINSEINSLRSHLESIKKYIK